MRTNPLLKAAKIADDRSAWSLTEHCEYANAQLILNNTNEGRRAKGMGPIKWFIRNGRVVCDWAQS